MLLALIVGPAGLMVAAIVLSGDAAFRRLIRSPKAAIAALALVAIVGAWWLFLPPYSRESIWLTLYLLVFPSALTGIAGFLIESGLHSHPVSSPWKAALGLLLLGPVLIITYDTAKVGYLGPVFALLLTTVAVTGMAIVIALWLAWTLRGWRKSASLVFAVALPVGLYASLMTGNAHSPESLTEQNGGNIVEALNKYNNSTGSYPERLTDLVPGQLREIPEALTTQGMGWLYEGAGEKFMLGN
jgi:hypothetical protein